MRQQTSLVLFCFISSITVAICNESFPVSNRRHHQQHNLKLFVFGDSYADTGNWPKSFGGSWQKPYGTTFPGSPSGRFLDGRVLTDYIGAFVKDGILGTKSPITYEGWKSGEKKSIKYGMNFANGGTGVFNTLDLPLLTKSIIDQLVINVKRIHKLGVQKIGITAMQPLGCLPQFTVCTLYKNCSNTENSVAEFHNQVLMETVTKLNNESDDNSLFVILDLFKAFSTALNLQQNISTGNSTSESLLRPCCQGVTKAYSCGNIEEGTKIMKYSVCGNPSESFFWDMIHPSQQGWCLVSTHLRSSLLELL